MVTTSNLSTPSDDLGLIIHDDELEKKVVVSLILSPQSFPDVRDILSPDCFHNLKFREIFEAFISVVNLGEIPDVMLVANNLARNSSLISREALLELCLQVAPAYSLRDHALTLKEMSLRRRLWEIGYNLVSKAGNLSESMELIHNEAKTAIDSLFEDLGDDLITMKDVYSQLQEDMMTRASMAEDNRPGTPTGFPEIDRNGGLIGSDLIVVGAETSQGKTSFATALALNAVKAGDHVAFYSMEMTPKQLTGRIAAMSSGISSSKILFGKMQIDEISQVDQAFTGFDPSLLHFDGKSSSSLDHILFSIRNMKIKYGIKGAVVDYLQLVNLSERGLSREQCVARIARDLKNLAKDLNIWIIAISQLSRNQQNPVPSLSRLRDSGQIEEAADNIFLIYRPKSGNYPAPFADITTNGTAMISIAKGRHIGTSEFICGFKPENTLFFPLENSGMQALMPQHCQSMNLHRFQIDNETPF